MPKKKNHKRKKATDLLKRIAENIRSYRSAMNFTQEQLQDLSGVRVDRYESGRHEMTVTALGMLSKHLNVEPYQLLK